VIERQVPVRGIHREIDRRHFYICVLCERRVSTNAGIPRQGIQKARNTETIGRGFFVRGLEEDEDEP
jgi:hypothetical protein